MDPLIKAVKTGSLPLVQKFIATHGIVFDDHWIDYLAVNHAIADEYEDIANFLLDINCRVKNTHDRVLPHQTPLHSAVKHRSSVALIVKLLEQGASVESLNRQGYSPLHLALILRNDEAVDTILDFILRVENFVDAKAKNGLSHFHVACTRKNVEVIEGFIKAGVDVDEAVEVDSNYRPGYTARHFAAESQSLEAVRILTNNTHSCVVDTNGETPEDLAKKSLEDLSVIVYLLAGESSQFHVACTQQNPQLVEKFIENGVADDDVVPDDATFCPGYSPLHFAVESNCKANVELLLKEGADVEVQDANFGTPLHLALYNENPDEAEGDTIVDLLYAKLSLEDKLYNLMDIFGLNYFHVAVTRDELELVETFLDAGQDIEHEVLFNPRQFAHYRPLHFAVRYRHLEMAEMLIDRGADVNAVSKDGTPMQIAVEIGDDEVIDSLLENSAKVNDARKIDGKTVLHLLVDTYVKSEKVQLLEYVEMFVQLGCDVNHKDDNGNTALHLACGKICVGIPCVRLLLDFGADINAENSEGETPFDCAFHDLYRLNADSYMLLYHHVQKLKVLGAKVNPRNEDCCQKILDESNECDPHAACFRIAQLDRMKLQRRDEVCKIKRVQLTQAMTLYGFLRLSGVDAATYMTNEKLRQIVGMEGEYPVYGYLIKLQVMRGMMYLKKARKRVAEHGGDEEKDAKRSRSD